MEAATKIARESSFSALSQEERYFAGGLGYLEANASYFGGSGAGRYQLILSYQYIGPDAGKPNVFRGAVASNEAVFEYK